MKRNFSGPVKTFAVGYREAEFSELSYARYVSQAIGTEHAEVVVGMEDFFNALPRLIWHEDEPIAWPSSVSLYFVSKLARNTSPWSSPAKAATRCSAAMPATAFTP